MGTRLVRSDTEERGRTTSCSAFPGHTEELGLPSESNGEPAMDFKQAIDLIRYVSLHFRKVILVGVWRMVWIKARVEEGNKFQSSWGWMMDKWSKATALVRQ